MQRGLAAGLCNWITFELCKELETCVEHRDVAGAGDH